MSTSSIDSFSICDKCSTAFSKSLVAHQVILMGGREGGGRGFQEKDVPNRKDGGGETSLGRP
jgi:hypothetical protein